MIPSQPVPKNQYKPPRTAISTLILIGPGAQARPFQDQYHVADIVLHYIRDPWFMACVTHYGPSDLYGFNHEFYMWFYHNIQKFC